MNDLSNIYPWIGIILTQPQTGRILCAQAPIKPDRDTIHLSFEIGYVMQPTQSLTGLSALQIRRPDLFTTPRPINLDASANYIDSKQIIFILHRTTREYDMKLLYNRIQAENVQNIAIQTPLIPQENTSDLAIKCFNDALIDSIDQICQRTFPELRKTFTISR